MPIDSMWYWLWLPGQGRCVAVQYRAIGDQWEWGLNCSMSRLEKDIYFPVPLPEETPAEMADWLMAERRKRT